MLLRNSDSGATIRAMNESAIGVAVKRAGGQASLARAIAVTPSLVYQWVTGRRPVAATHCRAIEAVTGVSRHALRPDVFGKEAA